MAYVIIRPGGLTDDAPTKVSEKEGGTSSISPTFFCTRRLCYCLATPHFPVLPPPLSVSPYFPHLMSAFPPLFQAGVLTEDFSACGSISRQDVALLVCKVGDGV